MIAIREGVYIRLRRVAKGVGNFERAQVSPNRNQWQGDFSWGERWDLNPRPSVPQTDALPAELRSPPGENDSTRNEIGVVPAPQL